MSELRNARSICVVLGATLAAMAAFLFGYSWLLAVLWGTCAGGLASFALETNRPRSNRGFYASLSLAVSVAAIWVFAAHGGV